MSRDARIKIALSVPFCIAFSTPIPNMISIKPYVYARFCQLCYLYHAPQALPPRSLVEDTFWYLGAVCARSTTDQLYP